MDSVRIRAAALLNVIADGALFASSYDERFPLSTIKLDLDGNHIIVQATDSYGLVDTWADIEGTLFDVEPWTRYLTVDDAAAMAALLKAAKRAKTEVTLTAQGDATLRLDYDDITVTATTEVDQYPTFDKLWPTGDPQDTRTFAFQIPELLTRLGKLSAAKAESPLTIDMFPNRLRFKIGEQTRGLCSLARTYQVHTADQADETNPDGGEQGSFLQNGSGVHVGAQT